MKTAMAKESGAPVSLRYSRMLLRELKNKRVSSAKKFLEGMLARKADLDGMYLTKTSKKVLEILKSAEANAKNKSLNVEKLFIKNAKADKPQKRNLAKSRTPFRGRIGKAASIEITVEER